MPSDCDYLEGGILVLVLLDYDYLDLVSSGGGSLLLVVLEVVSTKYRNRNLHTNTSIVTVIKYLAD